MSAKDFAKTYEAAHATQDWDAVAPLISDTARVIFSNGAFHAIKAAYQRNFSLIKGEEYWIKDVHWLIETAESAA